MLFTKKFNTPKSYGPFFRWKIIFILTFGLLGFSVVLSINYIYTNVYRTLEDANSIVVLNSSLSVAMVNVVNFEKAQKLIQLKSVTSTIPSPLRNIFLFETPSSTNPTLNVKEPRKK